VCVSVGMHELLSVKELFLSVKGVCSVSVSGVVFLSVKGVCSVSVS
jgi:hypothetical protein